MVAKLIAEEGILKGLILPLEGSDQWIIGRDPDACQLLIEDPAASRKHLLCRQTPEGIILENLSTTNPAQINQEVLNKPHLLKEGDTVKIGSGMFRFHSGEREDEENPSEAHISQDIETPNGEILQINGQQSIEPQPQKQQNMEQPVADPEVEKQASLPSPEESDESKEKAPVSENAPAAEEAIAAAAPHESMPPAHEGDHHDSIFEDDAAEHAGALAEINFDLTETGRWLLKVIGGPNNGAEFSMQASTSYLLGTDPNFCDIVFHDTSVSRQHARINVGEKDTLEIEDLKSRNGTLINGVQLTGKQPLPPNTVVSIGTTSFIVYDREGEMQTIISPLLPSIVKVLQKEEAKKEESVAALPVEPVAAPVVEKPVEAPKPHSIGAFILIAIITGLFIVVGIGTVTLFHSQPVIAKQEINADQALQQALAPFPDVKYSFNKNTGRLLLVGHVLTGTDRNQLLYNLQGMSFIKSLDESGVVIDEGVWREVNQVLSRNASWKGISIQSPSPGHFVISGYLKSRKQADQLWDYLGTNFPYLDRLEKKVVVEEDVIDSVNSLLQNQGIKDVSTQLNEGELVLSGAIPNTKMADYEKVLTKAKDIQGIRSIRNLVAAQAPEQSMVNISDRYEVTGISHQGGVNNYVVINGRILGKGDVLDGMTIESIKPTAVFLEKDGVKYRIDYSQ